MLAGHLLDPDVGLQLRVDEQRPAVRVDQHDRVLDREAVVWQLLLRHPLPDRLLVAQHLLDRELIAELDARLLDVLDPLLHALVAVADDERPQIRDAGPAQQRVPRNAEDVLLVLLLLIAPTQLLTAQSLDQLLRPLQLNNAQVHLTFQLLLLVHRFLVLVLQRLQQQKHLP